MRYWTLCFTLMFVLGAAPASASKENNIDKERLTMGLRIQAAPNRYTFHDYLSDLAASARDNIRKNPVSQLEARKDPRYEPLNPIVFRW